MTTSLIEAKNGMKDLGTKAQAVVDDDTLSPAEKMTRLENYAKDLKGFQDVVSIHETAARRRTGGESAPDAKAAPVAGAKTLAQEVLTSDSYRSAVAAKGGKYSFVSEIGTKVAATVDEGTTIANGQLNGAAGVLSLPNYLPGIVDIRFAPLAVADLFAQGSTDSPIVSYVKEATETVGAAARAEKGAIAQSDATFGRTNEQVGGIAAFFTITGEMLQDASQAESFISNRLIMQLKREEENEVLNGTGYPALAGILGRSGLQAALSAGTTGTIANPMLLAEAVHKQVTLIRTTAFVEPDAVVMNPTDWQYLQLAKDANNQYFSGGPFTGSYGNGGYSNVASLWGLRVVQSTRIASGTALVGGYQECGQLFRRQGITVEMTNSNEADFKANLITVRATSRSALAVYRPGGFGTVTITWA